MKPKDFLWKFKILSSAKSTKAYIKLEKYFQISSEIVHGGLHDAYACVYACMCFLLLIHDPLKHRSRK